MSIFNLLAKTEYEIFPAASSAFTQIYLLFLVSSLNIISTQLVKLSVKVTLQVQVISSVKAYS
jgi:hypothetical protein